jgi:hypothetical protein
MYSICTGSGRSTSTNTHTSAKTNTSINADAGVWKQHVNHEFLNLMLMKIIVWQKRRPPLLGISLGAFKVSAPVRDKVSSTGHRAFFRPCGLDPVGSCWVALFGACALVVELDLSCARLTGEKGLSGCALRKLHLLERCRKYGLGLKKCVFGDLIGSTNEND